MNMRVAALAAVLVTALGAAGAVTALAGGGLPDNSGPADRLTLAVFGDAPYGTTPTDTRQFEATPAFVDAINADPTVRMVLDVGDIHSGKQYCTRDYDRSVFELWTAFRDPLVYTPGDNEWADCHKPGEGGGRYNAATGRIDHVLGADGNPVDFAGGDPLANLDLVRSTFFPRPGTTLGARSRRVLSQSEAYDPAHPADAAYVENVMWERSRVLFVTVNLPGGSNNDQDVWFGAPAMSAGQSREIAGRTGADVRWLDLAFARARADGMRGVVIQTQADMWDLDGKPASHLSGYEPFVSDIAANTTRFGRPVLMLNGDSHVYASDNPLSASDPLNALHPGYDVPNFHRVVVHGSTLPLEYLRLTVDPRIGAPNGADAFGPFRWERVQP